jgi:hypothetical protein
LSLRRSVLLFLSLWSPCLGLHAAAYYVSASGSDLNPGTLALPWKTVSPVNGMAFLPGDQVYFAGGQTFAGRVFLSSSDSGSPGNPVILGSYGGGRATLAPPASQDGLDVVDGEWIEIQDLIIKGTGASSTGDGIQLYNSSTASRQHFWMRNCDIHGFGGSGLYVTAGTSTGGYHAVSATASDFHDNAGCGVNCDGYFWDQSPRPNGDFYFGGCRFYNNISSGLILVEMSNALVEYCEARNNGPSSGCIGFWCWSADHVTFQYCESHHNTRVAGGSDGGGFDLDGATRDSLLQYNYSHDNQGGGFALYQFAWAELSGPTIHNVIRYNVSEGDGNAGNYGGISMYGDGNFSGQPAPGDWVDYTEIYNNTIYTKAPATAAVEFIYNNEKKILFYNNIFYNSNVADFIHRDAGFDDGSIVFKNNAYWRPGGTFRIDFDGVVYNSLAAWQGSGAGNQEKEGATLRGFNVDPLLTAPGSGGTISPAPLSSLGAYSLQGGSPLKDQGVDLSTRLTLAPVPGSRDFWGSSIPQGPAYDIGACEIPLQTPTPTATATASPSITPSPTVSPTYSASPTASDTPTVTPSWSITVTHSITPTYSASPSATETRTATPTFSASPSPTATPTQTPSGTISPTFSISPTPTVTPTATPPPPTQVAGGPLEVRAHAPAPNPQAGPLFSFAVQLSHPATRVKLRLYSVAMAELRLAEAGLGADSPSGWQSATFELPDLANGLYFYRLEVEDARNQRALSRPGKLFVAR